MERARVHRDRRNRSAGVRRVVAGDADAARRRARAFSDQADVGRRLDRRSSHLTRWKVSRIRVRSGRRRQPGYLGAAGSGRSPVRLTRDTADEVEPSFSADGSRIAFRSSRLGGGVYIIPTLGGEERLLAARGFSPRFSPDGRWIAYGVAEPTGSRIEVAPAAGARLSRLPAAFTGSGTGLVPEGRHLLFWAQRHRDAPPEHNIDWYVTAIQGGSPVRTEARGVTSRKISGVSGTAVAGCVGPGWESHSVSWQRRRLLEHVAGGDRSGSWRISGVRNEPRLARLTKRRPRSPPTDGWCSSAERWGPTSGACQSTPIAGSKWAISNA